MIGLHDVLDPEGPLERDSAIQAKVEYIWDEPQAAIIVPDRLSFRPISTAEDRMLFRRTVAEVMCDSLDRADQQIVSSDPDAAVDSYMRPAEGFVVDIDWWHLARNSAGTVVGLTQPVVYRNSEKDGLVEGTIHYIGVVPEQRGNGYIDDLLRHATRVLQQIGVWRIYCDTDLQNVPMIEAFERVGYRRGRMRDVPLLS